MKKVCKNCLFCVNFQYYKSLYSCTNSKSPYCVYIHGINLHRFMDKPETMTCKYFKVRGRKTPLFEKLISDIKRLTHGKQIRKNS